MLIAAEEVRSFDRNGHKKRPKWTGRRGHCAEVGIDIGRNGQAEVDIVPKWALTTKYDYLYLLCVCVYVCYVFWLQWTRSM